MQLAHDVFVPYCILIRSFEHGVYWFLLGHFSFVFGLSLVGKGLLAVGHDVSTSPLLVYGGATMMNTRARARFDDIP
jgi:hypothetical protein